MIKSFLAGWDGFFFAPSSPVPIGLFRLIFGLNLFVMYAVRMSDWRFYFTDKGFVPSELALDVLPEFYRPSFSWYPSIPSSVFTMHAIFVIALFLLTIGFAGRLMALIAFILHLAFLQRNFSIAYGADLVATFFLFGLIFADSCRAFSITSLFRKTRKPQSPINSIFATVGVRLIQLQLCLIYGFSGMEKLKGESWWDGTAVWAVLGNQQIAMFDTSWLRHLPLVIAGMTLSTVLFEIYFPVLVWLKPVKKWLLLFGVMLHLMIAVTVGLVFFSMNMIAAYMIFINADSIAAATRRIFGARAEALIGR